jgi:hypothetical protein
VATEIYSQFYFIACRRGASKSDRRMDGYFVVSQSGLVCAALSGSRHLAPLPAGRHQARHFRARTEKAMTRDGVGFSVDLQDQWDPVEKRVRSLLRIHPDGGDPGTLGCVGITSDVSKCRDVLAEQLSEPGAARYLEIVYVARRSDMILVTPWGAFVWS